MDNQQAYNSWSAIYDSNINKTRDLEAVAIRHHFAESHFENILEIGCGTGKNTVFLMEKCQNLVGADFSEEMLAKAKAKISANHVQFIQTDITENWTFPTDQFDLVTCSLVLEHIENLDHVFAQVKHVLRRGGRFYLGEYHPFKQYLGKKAEFDTGNGVFELQCFVHHVSEFMEMATKNGFVCMELKEWFDDDDRSREPRILTMIFEKL